MPWSFKYGHFIWKDFIELLVSSVSCRDGRENIPDEGMAGTLVASLRPTDFHGRGLVHGVPPPFGLLDISFPCDWTPTALVSNDRFFSAWEGERHSEGSSSVFLLWCLGTAVGGRWLSVVKRAGLLFFRQGSGGEAGEEAIGGSSGMSDQTSFTVNKLRELSEKLEYKRQALSSIQNAPKPDKKVTV